MHARQLFATTAMALQFRSSSAVAGPTRRHSPRSGPAKNTTFDLKKQPETFSKKTHPALWAKRSLRTLPAKRVFPEAKRMLMAGARRAETALALPAKAKKGARRRSESAPRLPHRRQPHAHRATTLSASPRSNPPQLILPLPSEALVFAYVLRLETSWKHAGPCRISASNAQRFCRAPQKTRESWLTWRLLKRLLPEQRWGDAPKLPESVRRTTLKKWVLI